MRDIQSRPPTPRWVKIFGIIALIIVLLFVVLLLAPGQHGPRSSFGPRGYIASGATAAMMSPGVRNLALTAHVVASVGWLGAVAGFLALAIISLTGRDAEIVDSCYIAMEFTARLVIVPLSFASLVTGLVQSLGTKWGLFRHYWVLAKLLINVFASIVLLMYMPTLDYLASAAGLKPTHPGGGGAPGDLSPVLHSSAALLLLLVATVLAVYKPRGLTTYGWRKQQERLRMPEGSIT